MLSSTASTTDRTAFPWGASSARCLRPATIARKLCDLARIIAGSAAIMLIDMSSSLLLGLNAEGARRSRRRERVDDGSAKTTPALSKTMERSARARMKVVPGRR